MFTILVMGIHQDSVNECVVASVSNSTVEKCQLEQVPPGENCTRAYKKIKKLANMYTTHGVSTVTRNTSRFVMQKVVHLILIGAVFY